MNLALSEVKSFHLDIFNSMKSLLIFYTFVLFLTGTVCQAQTHRFVDRELKKASSDFNSLRYIKAIEKLNIILRKDSALIPAQEMLAYSYRQVKNYEKAIYWYEKLVQHKSIKAEWALNYAELLANSMQYEKSEHWYRTYLILVPDDKRASAFSRFSPRSLYTNEELWKVELTNINTPASEYSPAFYKSGLLFCSNRMQESVIKRVFPWDGTPFTNLYYIPNIGDVRNLNADDTGAVAKLNRNLDFNDDDTEQTSNDSRTLGQVSASLYRDSSGLIRQGAVQAQSLFGNVNTRYHEGPAAAFPDGSLIFTRNNYYKGKAGKSKEGITKLKLFIASGKDLSKIEEFPYNNNEYSTGHPALTADGNILVFSSDMPGGYGGSDLYYSVRSRGQWTRPVNLGKMVNTEGQELFPFISKSGQLFFSSTGHRGLGGLDVFQVALKDMKPQHNPYNLGLPINSSKDDFSLIQKDDGKSGFLSSNRSGNDNIYSFIQATFRLSLEGKITDEKSRIPLSGSRLVFKTLDGSDTVQANSKGEFKYKIRKETDYEVKVQKPGFTNMHSFVSTIGINADSTIHLDIKLNKVESPQQYVISKCDSLKKIFTAKNIYYDLDKDAIRQDARGALDALAKLMSKYPEIRVISSSHCDSRASEEYNRNLSLRRGASARDYLISKGIDGKRITIEYYGKARLLNRCFDGVPCSEANQQLNRRTEFDIILNGVNLTQQNCEDI